MIRFKQSLGALGLLALTALPCPAIADGVQDNKIENVRKVPPPGIEVPAEVREELNKGIVQLGGEIESLKATLKPNLKDLLPDVQIYHNAVRYALQYGEFFNANELNTARKLLEQGMERAKALSAGAPAWTTQTGLVVRGYVSKIDGSAQPYGLVVPASYSPVSPSKFRVDIWFHGRGEVLSEVNFLREHQTYAGEFAPANAFVIHPYGRYCNANKLAGEVDTFEALEHVKKHYPIDDNRVSVRGFSMGGAACWQFAVHFPGDWVAAAPGAGFSETADFLKVFQNEKVQPTWYEKALWHIYDCTDYALNLYNLPTVAYSGEKDSQKQAADIMEKAMAKEGISLTHIIGTGAGHFYETKAKAEVNRRIDAIVAKGRNPVPNHVRFTTWWLRYNRAFWVTVEGMGAEWERGTVDAEITDERSIKIATKNITALTLSMPTGLCPLDNTVPPTITIDGKKLKGNPVWSDRSFETHLSKLDGAWQVVASLDSETLRKKPGLQGPIDDAFMDSFLFVSPTGTPINAQIGAWVQAEKTHAIVHWRQQYRGEARLKNDSEVSAEDIANHNLVLWGDPSSNKILAQIADRLPIKWTNAGIVIGKKTYSADKHAPILIFPNPLNPKKYVVLNSSFTFREYDYLNNARQVPKLPDYAVVDTSQPITSRAPGGIVDAGFFNERWELKARK